ncbi:MAG: TIGR02266 family protein [Deltaproteobacteria bacterium]|nr:TIGR02266 family protein [Deltaproteobacteria bacterium]
MDKRRAYPRIKARIKIKLGFGDVKEFQDVYARNISKGGIFLATTTPLPKGTKVLIRLMPPGAVRPFEIKGEVAHSVDTPEAIKKKRTPGMGIKFTDLTKPKQAAIEQFIKDLLSGRIRPDNDMASSKRDRGSPVHGIARTGNTVPIAGPAPNKIKPGKSSARPAGPARSGITAPYERPDSNAGQKIKDYRSMLDRAERLLDQRKYYDLFKVKPTAMRQEIKDAYTGLAKSYHPDLAPRDTPKETRELANTVFARIGKVFEMLTNPEKRVEYDLSIGVERDPEDEAEARVLGEHKARYREIYLKQFPDRVDKARRFAEMAEQAVAKGDMAGAINGYKIALSFDPLNEELKARKRALEKGV